MTPTSIVNANPAKHFTTEDVQGEHREGRGARRDDRARQGLVDAGVDELIELVTTHAAHVFPNTIKHNDRVVHRVPGDRQHRGHDVERELVPEEHQHRHRDEDVVRDRDDRAEAEAEAKTPADIEQDAGHREGECLNPPLPQLRADHRSHQLLADDLEPARGTTFECRADRQGTLLETHPLFRPRLRQSDHDLVVRRGAVLLDDLLACHAPEGLPYLGLGDRRLELEDDQRAAREIDAEREPTAGGQHRHTPRDDRQRQRHRVPALADEIEIRFFLKQPHGRLAPDFPHET